MKKNPFDIIWQMVLFHDGHGFILGKNSRSHDFCMTMQFVRENGQLRCYRGSCHGNLQEARQDFHQRVKDYQQEHGVRIAQILGMNTQHPRGSFSRF